MDKQKTGFGKETGISVWVYSLSQGRTEINPEKEKPDYVTQTNEEGKYSLNNLSLGKYRLFAVKDANKDLLWNWDSETIGVTTEDVELTEQNKSKAFTDFIIEKIDKSMPSLLDCRSLNKNLTKLGFDEELEERSALDSNNFKITSASTQKSLQIISVFFQDTDTKILFLLTEPTNPKEEYELKVLDVKDRAGNHVDTASNSCRFIGSEIPDTIGLQVRAVLPKDKVTDIPLDTKIKLTFNQPPEPQTVGSHFSLADSNGIKITGKGEWTNPTAFVFSPDSLLSGKMQYQIKLLGNEIRKLLGNSGRRDTIFISSFLTLNPDTLGTVSGKVQLGEKGGSAPIVLSLWQLGQVEILYQITLLQPGPFLFERILPGKYRISGYIDLNKDGELSLGQPDPFSPLEPFVVHPDTIYVRSRWETEGVELKFH